MLDDTTTPRPVAPLKAKMHLRVEMCVTWIEAMIGPGALSLRASARAALADLSDLTDAKVGRDTMTGHMSLDHMGIAVAVDDATAGTAWPEVAVLRAWTQAARARLAMGRG